MLQEYRRGSALRDCEHVNSGTADRQGGLGFRRLAEAQGLTQVPGGSGMRSGGRRCIRPADEKSERDHLDEHMPRPIEARCLSGVTGIRHGFFTRDGGVSGAPYVSLNCGAGSRDRPEAVSENRARVARHLGAEALVTPYQVHSPDVVVAEAPWTRETAPKADGVVTRKPGLAVAVLTADCTPVLFADPAAGVVGAAHAGWRGALSGVLEATVVAMERLGADRARIRAAVGPTISGPNYEVGPEFEAEFLAADSGAARFFTRRESTARPRFDLPAFARDRLARAGVKTIEDVGLCTYAEDKLFFSYRRAQHRAEPDYGRQISAIILA